MHSTGYTLAFAGVVCVVCSVFVSGSAVLLKDRQTQNAVLDRQSKVLTVAGLQAEGEKLSPAEIQKRFAEGIEPEVVELQTGEVAADIDPKTYDQGKALSDPEMSREAPENAAKVRRLPKYGLVYKIKGDDGIGGLILPVEGKGLWSTLYGFLALDKDLQTIKGITFYKHGETPGLGGEVDNPRWKALWVGRKAFDASGEPKIAVIKGQAGTPEEDPYKVDGLSGATLTSRGVTHLVQFWLDDQGFGPYLDRARNAMARR